jgi:hypothetical protein
MGLDIDTDFDANPYAPPTSSTKAKSGGRSELGLFLRWERLRLIYNAVLGVETVLVLMANPPRGGVEAMGSLAFVVAAYAVVANVCFCAGPVLEGYARLLKIRGTAVTGLLFGLGTAFAMMLTLVACLSLGGFFVFV